MLMRLGRLGPLLGAMMIAALCVAIAVLGSATGQSESAEAQGRLQRAAPALFTVIARPPYGQGMLGVRALTLGQTADLQGILSDVAEVGIISGWTSSAQVEMIKDGVNTVVKPRVYYVAVSESYFRLMGLALTEGRGFTAEEVASGSRVCVIGSNRPEKRFHSDPEGDMAVVYKIVGRLAPTTGAPFPVPKSWRNPANFPSMNDIVLVPITARAPVPYHHPLGLEEAPEWAVPLVAPFPGKYEEALRIVTEFMEAKWPGWTLDFGIGNEVTVAVQDVGRRVGSYFAYVSWLLLGLTLTTTASFTVLRATRGRRDSAVRRSLGATRTSIVLGSTFLGVVVAGAGVLAAFGAVSLLAPALAEYLGLSVSFTTRTGFLYGGTVALAAALAALGAESWVTALDPGAVMRRGTTVGTTRSVDVRVVLAGLSLLAAVATVASLLVTSRAQLASLEGYLRGVGENCVAVRQDFSKAEVTFGDEGLLGPQDAARLRGALSSEWDVVCQSVLSITLRRGAQGRDEGVLAYGLDEYWPSGEGFAVSDQARALWSAGPGEQALLGGRLAMKLFGSEDPVGKTLELGDGTEVTIAGVLEPRPTNVVDRLADRDSAIILHSQVLDRQPEARIDTKTTEVLVYVNEGIEVETAVRQVEQTLRAAGRTSTGITAQAVIDEVSGLRETRSRMNRFQVGLGWAILVVAALMLGMTVETRVAERRREIGIRRAVGATPARIAGGVLGETLGLSFGGGVLGLVAGHFVAACICAHENWPLTSSLVALVQAAGGLLAVSCLAALLPMRAVLSEAPLTSLREGE